MSCNKNTIKENFSKHADYYDEYCSVQNHSAKKLILMIKKNNPKNILDVGCGTGNYTQLLRKKFPNVNIKAIDISNRMVEIARKKITDNKIRFIVADAEKKRFIDKFDMITSNATFQWFSDLEKSLIEYKKLLINNGIILFSIFGPKTFYELNTSLNELHKKDIELTSCRFTVKNVLSRMLEAHFKKVFVEEETFYEKYDSLLQLLNKIKYTGTRGNGISVGSFWTHKKITDLEKIYKKKFDGIKATYQIFYCQGIESRVRE